MKLTSYTNYALRALQLAALRAPELVRIAEVASVHGIANAHVSKAVHELGKHGFLTTHRGRGGGFELAKPPESIIVGDIVRLTEGSMDIVECFDPETNTCPLIGVCRLSRALRRASEAFMDVLDELTVADIASNRDQLLGRIVPLLPLETLDARRADDSKAILRSRGR